MDVEQLLQELCVDLGICLPPDKQREIVESNEQDVDIFTNKVLVAEGLDPNADPNLRDQVRERVARHFGS